VELLVHLVWATRGRTRTIAAPVERALAGIFERVARSLGAEVLAAGAAEDHVHLLMRHGATRTLAELVQRLKGVSSHDIAHTAGGAELSWQDGYYARSVSPETASDLFAYIRDQRAHHAASAELETWERIDG